MDPITIVGFDAALAQLIDVTSKTVNYLNDIKDAPTERAELAREAAGLYSLLVDLRYRLQETNSTDPWFKGLHSLAGQGGPLEEFEATMKDLAKKLAPAEGVKRVSKALRSTLDKKDIHRFLLKVERFKTLVNLALQEDQL